MKTNTLKCVGWVMGMIFAAQSQAVLEYDQNVTPDVIFGSGNANGFFTVERNAAAGVEVGLRAKIPFTNTFNSQGDGTYVFTLAETDHDNNPSTPNRFNIEFSVNTDYLGQTGNVTGSLSYEIGIDTDPSEGVSYAFGDPILVDGGGFLAPDHSFGDNSTVNGGGVVAVLYDTYINYLNTYNVVQNSNKYQDYAQAFSFAYDPNIDATYDVYLAVKDGATILAMSQIRVIIGAGGTPVNSPPEITSTPPATVLEDSLYSYTLIASDPDNDPLTFSVVGALPGWLSFDPATGLLTGTPTANDIGSHAVVLSVTDGTATVNQNFTVTVLSVNDPPSFTVGCELDATDVTGPGGTTLVYSGYVSNILVGPPDEQASQTYVLTMGVAPGGDPDGLVTGWTITTNGDITIDVDTSVSSVASLVITMTDDGGTANGGIDSSSHQFNLHHYADLQLDPDYAGLPAGDIINKNTFEPCR